MEYREEFTKDKKASQVPELGLIRKAVESIIKDGALSKYEMGDQLKTIDVNTTRVLQEIADKLDDLEIVTKNNKPESTGELKQAFVKFAATLQNDRETVKTVKVEAISELTKAITDLHFTTLKQSSKTDPNDPSDYTNVRLTNGKEFYNAVSRAIAGIAESFNPFVKSDGQTPTSIVLNADGTLPTSATVTPAANQNVTLTNSIPIGGNLIGAVVLASGVTVAPNTGIQDVFVRGGQAVSLSGSVSVNFPIQQNVSVSGIVSSSGIQNVHVDNWPTVQHVFTENPVTSVTVNGLTTSGVNHVLVDNFPGVTVNQVQGTVSTSGTVGGTIKAVIDNVPHMVVDSGSITVNTHTLASGVDSVNVANYPTIQTVNVNNTPQVTISGQLPAGAQVLGQVVLASGITVLQDAYQETFVKGGQIVVASGITVNGTVSTSGTVGGTLTAIVPNTVATTVTNTPHVIVDSGSITVNTHTLASGTDNVNVTNFPTIQTVGLQPGANLVVASGLTTSGVQHTLVDNFPSGFSINQVQGTVRVDPTGTTTQPISGTVIANAGTGNFTTIATSGTLNAHIDNFPSSQTVNFNPGFNVVVASGLTTSGVQHTLIDNFPSGFSINGVQGTVTAAVTSALAASGVNNSHIDNWPLVQHVFVENPVSTVSVTGLTTSGTNHILVDNFPSGIEVNQVAGIVSVSGTVTNTPGVTIATSGTINGNVTTISTSGNFHSVIDNFPSGFSVNGVQGTVQTNITNTSLAVTATSGTQNVHVDNWPLVQHTFVENPTTSVAVTGTVTTSGTVGGTVNAVIQNFNPLQETFSKGGQIVVASGVAISSVLAASGVQNVHVDNYPSVQAVSQNGLPGNWTVNNSQVAGTTVDVNTGNASAGTQRVVLASNQPTVTVSGSVKQPVYELNSTPILTIAGNIASLGMTTVVSGIASQYIKVFAYSIVTNSTTAVTASFVDTNAIQAWRLPLQAITGTYFGSNLVTDAPNYIFKTATAGAGLAINLSAAQSVDYNLSYFYDSSAI